MSKISIALATYNGAAFLREQLTSLATQSLRPDELVIRDDSSSDGTVAICRAFAADAPFEVRLERNPENVGYRANFERILRDCDGDIVFLCDQDDVWYPHKIETMVRALDEHPNACLAIHDLQYCDRELRATGETKLERIEALGGTARDYVTGMATAVRRELLECALPYPDSPIHAHDSWLHDCASAIDGKLVLDEVLADYRRHDENATSASTLNRLGLAPKRARWMSILAPTSVADLAATAQRYRDLSRWLTDWRDELEARGLTSSSQLRKRTEEYRRIAAHADERADLLQRPRAARVAAIVQLWRRGGYGPFQGARSALKDFVQRPRARSSPDERDSSPCASDHDRG